MNFELLTIILFLNIIGFTTIGIDKYKAIRYRWRISEKTLFLIALTGGAVGVYVGMIVFKHKIRNWKFIVGIPLVIIVEVLGYIYFIAKINNGE